MSESPENAERPESQVGAVEAEGATTALSAVATAAEAPAATAVGVPAASAKPPVRRGRIAAIAGSVLLAAAVIAGVGCTVVTVDAADRDAGAPAWKFPKTTADAKNAPEATGLAGMLLPYDDRWTRGPDIAEFGSGASLSGGQATDLRKESLRDLPRSQRRQLEREIEKQDIQGMAMRSYLGTGDSLSSEDALTVSIELVRMDRGAARNSAAAQKEFLGILDVFRKGPKIEGHKNAQCFLTPKDADVDLDAMFCLAAQGDVLVTASAYGVRSLDTKAVARLVGDQLGRIAEPGEAV